MCKQMKRTWRISTRRSRVEGSFLTDSDKQKGYMNMNESSGHELGRFFHLCMVILGYVSDGGMPFCHHMNELKNMVIVHTATPGR
jgi:hypothetical protein